MFKIKNNEKFIAIILVIVFIIMLIPLLYIGKYDYHCADDFGYSAASHIAWEDTHSLVSVLQAATNTVVEHWFTWQGTFSTMYLMALEPGIYGDVFYHFVPWLMIGMMTVSTMFFLYMILVRIVNCSPWVWLSISMIYLIYAMECIVDPVQGFYWYNGASHYMIPHGIALIIGTLILSMLMDAKLSIAKLIVTCVLAFFLGGTNYITGLNTVIAFVLAICLCLMVKRKDKLYAIAVPFLCFIPAFLLNTLAPGNFYRQEEMMPDHPGPIKAIFLSFYFCLESVTENWMDWTTILFVGAMVPFCICVVKKLRERFYFRYPLLVMAVSFGFLSATFTPTSYVAATTGGGRVDNIIFLDFLLLVILNLIYIIGWLDRKLSIVERFHNNDILENRAVNQYMIFIAVSTVFFAGMYAKVDADFFTSSSAVKSILSGEAAAYGAETTARTKSIEACDGEELVIPRFVEQPYLLYFDDIIRDPDDWKNKSMERYYRIEKISAYSVE